MTRLTTSKTRPALLAIALCVAAAGSASAAGFNKPSQNGVDPFDRVPSYVGLARFSQLEPARLYDLNIASRRGRSIRIADCTMSQSKAVLRTSVKDHAAAIEMVKTLCK